MKTQIQKWKDYIAVMGSIDIRNNPNERIIREAISELRKEGIILIPIKAVYHRIENLDQETIDNYVKHQIAHMQTQYFNTLLPVKKYVKNEKLINLIGQLSFMDIL